MASYPRLAGEASTWLTALAARTVAAVTAAEIPALQPFRRTEQALLFVDLGTLAVSTHRVQPDPFCGCGALPEQSADDARVMLQPRPKPTPGTYRIRPLGSADLDRLRRSYVDDVTGVVKRAETFTEGSLAVGVAQMRSRWADRAELSWGRTPRHRTSEMVAILEALERHGGMAPGGRRGGVQAAFADLGDRAVDPRTFGLHAPDQYDQPGFPFQPFHPDRVCRWVWGYSFGRQEPVLVPQAYAYYRSHRLDPGDPSFAYEISNGCALGSCLEEAILYGILEVVERDAFLLTWYARLAAARIDLSSAADRSVPILAALIEADTGYQVLAFDITMEHGIPSVWAMAVSPSGADSPAVASRRRFPCRPRAGGHGRRSASWDPILADLLARYPDIAERGRRWRPTPRSVTAMDDHSVLHTSPQAAARLDFLATATVSRTFAELRAAVGDTFATSDLRDDLTAMLAALGRHSLDVIVVDQTTPEHRAGGLCCVKVIVPGLLPMTFGQQHRRVHGLPRLYHVPRLLGYRDRALTRDEVNPDPHPFP